MNFLAIKAYLKSNNETGDVFALQDDGEGVFISRWDTPISKPTETDLAPFVAVIDNNEPIYRQLEKLDNELPRFAEDDKRGRGIKKYDDIIAQKDALRARIVK